MPDTEPVVTACRVPFPAVASNNVSTWVRFPPKRLLGANAAAGLLVGLDAVEELLDPGGLLRALRSQPGGDVAVERDLDEVRVREVVFDGVEPGADVEPPLVRRAGLRGLQPVVLDPLAAVVDVVLQACVADLEQLGVLDLASRGCGACEISVPIWIRDRLHVGRLPEP